MKSIILFFNGGCVELKITIYIIFRFQFAHNIMILTFGFRKLQYK